MNVKILYTTSQFHLLVLHVCAQLDVKLRTKTQLRVFENRVLRGLIICAVHQVLLQWFGEGG